MAHPNINERRKAVKELILSGEYTRKDMRDIAYKFGTTYTSVFADLNDILFPLNGKPRYASKKIKLCILKRDNYTCMYCDGRNKYFLIDHVVPVSMGGYAAEYNLVVACASCNSYKKGMVAMPNNSDLLEQLNPVWYSKIVSMLPKELADIEPVRELVNKYKKERNL